MTPRLPLIEPPYPPEIDDDLRKLMPPGVPPLALFRVIAHNPRVLGRVRRGGLLDPGAVTLREREIAILRTTARCGAEYEWGVHVTFFASAAGLTAEQIAATVDGAADAPVWAPREQLVIALCDALHDQARVPAPLWSRLAAAFTPSQLIELIVLVGQYHMVSFVANALELPPEDTAARFPGSSAPDQPDRGD